ncbi:MAG: hypothetical protein IK045_09515 [Bacteroidales bacterium]|nr:hypothetical protein [Bacteroidales bacterium]
MKKTVKTGQGGRTYQSPTLRFVPLKLQKGLCVSGGLSPVEEEDAGIDQWGN